MSVILLIEILSFDKNFFKFNRRYIYNVNDYLNIKDIKDQLTQCFAHIYRRKRYNFIIVYVIKKLREKNEDIFDFVLKLSIYYRRAN